MWARMGASLGCSGGREEILTGVDVLNERGQMREYDTTVVPETCHGVNALFCSGYCGGWPR